MQLRFDLYANWVSNNPVLKSGEVALVEVPAATGAVASEPAILFKVGDGVKPFNDLPWGSALAADVHTWAKSATKPTYQASEIKGIDTYIANYVSDEMGISADTDTQYTIVKVNDYQYKMMSKSKLDTEYTNEVGIIDIPKYDDTAITARISELEAAIGEGGSVATQIANIISKLDYEDTAKTGQFVSAVSETDGVISVNRRALVADDVPELAISKIAGLQNALDDKAAASDLSSVSGKVDTLIGDDANKSARAIAAEETAKIVAGADASLDTLKEIADWISSHSTDAAAMNSAILALQAQLAGIGEGNGTVKKYIDDAITALKIGDYAKAADLTALADRVTTAEGDIDALEALVGTTAVATQISNAINALDSADAEVEGQFVVAVPQKDGKVSVSRKAVNINVVEQTSGDVLILDCGNSIV